MDEQNIHKTGATPQIQPKLTRKEREKRAHRAEILAAAERIFAAKGFNETTIEEIAKAAEFSVGAVYTFFASKADLCAEVIRKIADDFMASFAEQVQACSSPVPALRHLIILKVMYVASHAAFLRMLMEGATGQGFPPASLRAECHAVYDRYLQALAQIMEKGMAAGQIRRMDPLHAAIAFEGVGISLLAYWTRKQMSLPPERQAEIIENSFLKHICL